MEYKLKEVVAAYRASRGYQALAAATRLNTDKALARVAQFMDRPIKRLTKSVVMAIADDLPAGAAYVFLTRMRALMRFARERDMVEMDPTQGLSLPKQGEHRPWEPMEVDAFLKEGVNDQVRMAIMLGYYTGQRLSDVLRMRWSDISNGAIYVCQMKTRAELFIPIHPMLQRALDKHPRNGDTIISMGGAQYDRDTFRRKFARERDKLDLPKDLVFHGLRKTLACMLAAKGATTEQIKAVGGWKTTAQVDGYTRRADQFALAKGALARLI